MQSFFNYLSSHKKAAMAAFILVLIPVLLFILRFFALPQQPFLPRVTAPTPVQQKPFSVVSTSPRDNEANVYPGEIIISFTTDSPIVSKESYSLGLNPTLKYSTEVLSTFPTTQIQTQILGGLDPSTTYTVSVFNSGGEIVHSWSFTTSSVVPESSSQLINKRDQDIIKTQFPLALEMSYKSSTVDMDYSGPLELSATVKNGAQEAARQEIETWIQSKGVDPKTHIILFK